MSQEDQIAFQIPGNILVRFIARFPEREKWLELVCFHVCPCFQLHSVSESLGSQFSGYALREEVI